MLTPQQLEIISNEYYIKGFVHGRNRLYNHMKLSYPNVFDSRDAIGEWLKYQEVNQFFQYQKKNEGCKFNDSTTTISQFKFRFNR